MGTDKHSKGKIKLDELSKESGFAMPNGYFEKMEGIHLAQNVWENLTKETHFGLPDGYFDELPQIIQKRIAPKGYFDWSKVFRSLDWSVPENYFEQLPYKVVERVGNKRPVWDWKLILSLLSPRFVLPLAMGCFMIGYVVIRVFETPLEQASSITQLDNAAIREYLIDHQSLGDEQLAERIPDGKVGELETAVPNNISKEEMEDNIDMSSLDESTI